MRWLQGMGAGPEGHSAALAIPATIAAAATPSDSAQLPLEGCFPTHAARPRMPSTLTRFLPPEVPSERARSDPR